MSLRAGGLRFPCFRVLLPRTRLAYVHLRNLFTDAKRDRAARVFGYVCVWLPDEFLLFFMQEGEIVNATASPDGQRFHPIAIADAISRVPREAEYGEVCFQEGDDEQLAMMYWSQLLDPIGWPTDLAQDNPEAVLGFLHATMHDGVLEVIHEERHSYAVVRQGKVVRGYFADERAGTAEDQVRALLNQNDRWVRARLWPVPQPLPLQAPPALIQAYRELMSAAVSRLTETGADSAATVAEHACRHLAARHPSLERMPIVDVVPPPPRLTGAFPVARNTGPVVKDPIVETQALSAAVGAWLGELLWNTPPGDGTAPERFLEDLCRERRHLFQKSGLFDALPWKLFV